ncbi:MAG: DNA-binding protein [Candidatus Omnitrophica bacterium CG12_big_fil_rev_8_21_14_0_65_50_5]|nr:MAG: DNA-binding protein [Candidatus Omnitrophica bacterium CG12_big_fil_rev_8_21_14_0_65_50_5]
MTEVSLIPAEAIQSKILWIRNQKVMLDRDLAQLYNVETKQLNQAVKRNSARFPEDFMFQLTKTETHELVTNCDRFMTLRHSTSFPFAFTEHGILMLSSVLNSERAVQVNIQIMRTFAKLRELMATHKNLKGKIEEMEKKYDYQFKAVFEAIKKLIDEPARRKRPIGFHVK